MPKSASKLAKPEIILRDIPVNTGLVARYRKALQLLLRDMAVDARKRLKRAYRPAKERLATDSLAMDDDPVIALRSLMLHLSRRWQRRFDRMAKDIAEDFATRSQADFDFAFRKRLKEAGFTVRFRPTEHMVSSYRAVVAENVALIRSVPQQFLKDVEGAVWRSALKGGGAYELSTEIRAKYGVAARRAAFIAQDQTAKSRTTFEASRRMELGIKFAIWRHSHAGKTPRPSHVEMDGKRFEIAKGMWDPDVQQWIQPGYLPRCRCTSRAVI